MTDATTRAREIRDKLADVPQRIGVVAKLAKSSGLMWGMTIPGVRALAKVLTGPQNPSQLYRLHATNTPSKPAVKWRDQTITFGELDRRIDAIASSLQKRGMGKGASVVLMMKNRPEFLEAAGATARMGGAAVAVSWRSTPTELAYLVNHCGAKAIVYEHDLHGVVDQARKEMPNVKSFFTVGGRASESEPFENLLDGSAYHEDESNAEVAAVVIYTSGTTGKPKGAVRKFSKDAMPAFMRFLAETPMRIDDIHLCVCPMYHSTAFGFLTLSHVLGATVAILDEFKPEPFLAAIERYGVTQTAVVPTMLHRVLQLGPETIGKYNTRSLRAIFAGGAPLPGPVAVQTMDQFGDILFNFYGATETGLVTLAKPADLRAAPWTIGRAVPGNEIRLVGDDGREVGVGEVGELYVRNKMLVAGYHQDDKATNDSMREGFFSVGDLARKDRDGRFFIEGRKRDMIISGGVNVYPAEVEGVLEQHHAIAEVAVVGVEDQEWGERVRAFVVLKHGALCDEAELKLWTRERLAGPKVPRDYVFLDSLPRNPTGKVLKRDLRNHK